MTTAGAQSRTTNAWKAETIKIRCLMSNWKICIKANI